MKKVICILGILAIAYIGYSNFEEIMETFVNHSEVVEASSNVEVESDEFTILIDAGHGGYDCGSEAIDGTCESEITLDVALQVGSLLEEVGYNIVYTRDSDEIYWEEDNLSDLKARIAIAEAYDADLFISLHTNFSSYGDGATGYEIYADLDDDKSVALSNEILDSLDSVNYSINRGIKDGIEEQFYIIRKSSVPTALIELGFLSDYNEYLYMNSSEGQNNIAQAIVNGIIAYIE